MHAAHLIARGVQAHLQDCLSVSPLQVAVLPSLLYTYTGAGLTEYQKGMRLSMASMAPLMRVS